MIYLLQNFDVIDAIFNMDWLVLSTESRKMFFFVMLSASNEVNLFNNAIVSLTPQMFLKVKQILRTHETNKIIIYLICRF